MEPKIDVFDEEVPAPLPNIDVDGWAAVFEPNKLLPLDGGKFIEAAGFVDPNNDEGWLEGPKEAERLPKIFDVVEDGCPNISKINNQ